MKRRSLLAGSAAGIATLAAPRIGSSESLKIVKFVPQADLALLDPVQTTAPVTRNHGYLVFDTLYGMDENLQPQPQRDRPEPGGDYAAFRNGRRAHRSAAA